MSTSGTSAYCHSHKLLLKHLEIQVKSIHKSLESIEYEVHSLTGVKPNSARQDDVSQVRIFSNPPCEQPALSANISRTFLPADCTCVSDLSSTVRKLENHMNAYMDRLDVVSVILNHKVQLYSAPDDLEVTVSSANSRIWESVPQTNVKSSVASQYASNPLVPYCLCCDDCVRCLRWFCDSLSVKLSKFKSQFNAIKLQMIHLQEDREREAIAYLESVQNSTKNLQSKLACINYLESDCTNTCNGITDFESIRFDRETLDNSVRSDTFLSETSSIATAQDDRVSIRSDTILLENTSVATESQEDSISIRSEISISTTSEVNVDASQKRPLLSTTTCNDTTMPVSCVNVFKGVKSGSILHKAKKLFSKWKNSKLDTKYTMLEKSPEERKAKTVELKFVKWVELNPDTGDISQEDGFSGTAINLDPVFSHPEKLSESGESQTDSSSHTTVKSVIQVESCPTPAINEEKIVQDDAASAQDQATMPDTVYNNTVNDQLQAGPKLVYYNSSVNLSKQSENKILSSSGVSPSKKQKFDCDRTSLKKAPEVTKRTHHMGKWSSRTESKGRQLIIPTLYDTTKSFESTPTDGDIMIEDELGIRNIDHNYCKTTNTEVEASVYKLKKRKINNVYQLPQTESISPSKQRLGATFIKRGDSYVYKLGEHPFRCRKKLEQFWSLRPYMLFGHITEEKIEELLDQPDYCSHHYNPATNEISRALLEELYRVNKHSARFFARELVWKLFNLRDIHKKRIPCSDRALRKHECLDKNIVNAIKYSVLSFFPIEEIYWKNRCVPFINHCISDLFSRKFSHPVIKSFIQRNTVSEYVV